MRAAVLVPVLLLVACVGTGKLEESQKEAGPAAELPAAELVPMEGQDSLDRPRVHLPADAKSRNFNATLVAGDPIAAVAKARALLEEMGAEMVGVSSGPEYSNVSARLSNAKCADLPQRVRALGYEATSENLSVSDLRSAVQQIEDRLARLDRADREVRRILRGVADDATADGLLVMRELAGNERRNLEQQLTSYSDQARYCQVYVNFQKQPPVLDH
jgi:hypothetical protein